MQLTAKESHMGAVIFYYLVLREVARRYAKLDAIDGNLLLVHQATVRKPWRIAGDAVAMSSGLWHFQRKYYCHLDRNDSKKRGISAVFTWRKTKGHRYQNWNGGKLRCSSWRRHRGSDVTSDVVISSAPAAERTIERVLVCSTERPRSNTAAPASRLLPLSVCQVDRVVLDQHLLVVAYLRLDESSATADGPAGWISFAFCSLSPRRCSMKRPFVVCSARLLIITLIGEYLSSSSLSFTFLLRCCMYILQCVNIAK